MAELQKWDAEFYDRNHGFVSSHGRGLVELLSPKSGENILDLGCGTGELTSQIADSGAITLGFDASGEMIGKARRNFPGLRFEQADATSFQFPDKFDAVFSNAVLHWVPESGKAASRIYDHLKKSGRFVAEFGGKGNNRQMLSAMRNSMTGRGHLENSKIDFWFYPSIAEYSKILEEAGFRVTAAWHFDRPTPLSGSDGMRNWFRMFGSRFFIGIDPKEIEEIYSDIEKTLKPEYFKNDTWIADYVRIRICATKE